MPKGALIINEHDAYTDYGISLEDSAMSSIMTPPPMKAVIESKYRKSHGKVTVNKTPRYDERDVTLAMHINARTKDEFFSKYSKFCDEILSTGRLMIKTKYQPDVLYRFNYVSCTQFSEFNLEYAAFSLKLNEPDPTNRAVE